MRSRGIHSMKAILTLISILCLSALCVCVTATGISAAGSEPAQSNAPRGEIPKFNVGDKWKFNTGVTLEIKEILGNGVLVERHGRARQSECGDVLMEEDVYGTVLAVKSLAGVPLSKCETGWRLLDFPLSVGKEWDFKANGMSESLGSICTYLNKIKVLSYEDVTVPAGALKAFKIQHRQQNLCNQRREWYLQSYYWYAPDIKRIVKSMDSNNNVRYQLESYELK